MKKRISWIYILAMCICLCACGKDTSAANDMADSTIPAETAPVFAMQITETEEITLPTTAPTTEAATEPTTATATQPAAESEYETMVWIPKSGSKYHSRPGCSNMDNPSEVPVSEAERRGFTPCKKCH